MYKAACGMRINKGGKNTNSRDKARKAESRVYKEKMSVKGDNEKFTAERGRKTC